jgi:hypothetical protein
MQSCPFRTIQKLWSCWFPSKLAVLGSILSYGVNARLNLTAASHVFVFEPAWNPAIEQQAIDRVHRLGQTSDVQVIRYIAKGYTAFNCTDDRFNRGEHGGVTKEKERVSGSSE